MHGGVALVRRKPTGSMGSAVCDWPRVCRVTLRRARIVVRVVRAERLIWAAVNLRFELTIRSELETVNQTGPPALSHRTYHRGGAQWPWTRQGQEDRVRGD